MADYGLPRNPDADRFHGAPMMVGGPGSGVQQQPHGGATVVHGGPGGARQIDYQKPLYHSYVDGVPAPAPTMPSVSATAAVPVPQTFLVQESDWVALCRELGLADAMTDSKGFEEIKAADVIAAVQRLKTMLDCERSNARAGTEKGNSTP